MMRWRPWPPLTTKKYEVGLVVRRLEGWDLVREAAGGAEPLEKEDKWTAEIMWKGSKVKVGALSSLRRAIVKRNFTREVEASSENGVIQWDEEFHSVCSFSAYKDNVFHPWEIVFTVFNVSSNFGSHISPSISFGSQSCDNVLISVQNLVGFFTLLVSSFFQQLIMKFGIKF